MIMVAKKSGFRYKHDKEKYQAKKETWRHREVMRKKMGGLSEEDYPELKGYNSTNKTS